MGAYKKKRNRAWNYQISTKKIWNQKLHIKQEPYRLSSGEM